MPALVACVAWHFVDSVDSVDSVDTVDNADERIKQKRER
jgi:hypothetical protein